MTRRIGFNRQFALTVGLVAAMAALSGCDGAPHLGFLKPREAPADRPDSPPIDGDAEAPELFQKTEAGLWDGRPSLGGVWVAHPDVSDPHRVIIRNTSNGESVIGALFRRERELPGPRFQVSSDAAGALGMLAGAPAELTVTALTREAGTAPDGDDPRDDTDTALAEPDPASEPDAPDIDGTYVQLGIFSLETNAESAAERMRKAGLTPVVRKQSAGDKTSWRVLVGPAGSAAERATLLKRVRGAGFPDAYAVTDRQEP